MGWTRDALVAIKRIILIEDRSTSLCKQAVELMDVCKDLDRRLVRQEAKFELLERMAAPSRRSLPEKTAR